MFLIDKVAFNIGGIEVRWYGIIIAFGALLAALLATRVARIRGENPDHIWQVFPWALIGGIIGARVGFFVAEPSTFKGLESLNPLSGGFQGLSIQGAMVGGILACWIYSRFSKLPLFRLMDVAAPGIAMAQGIGRLGNFVNQEAYGTPCAPNEPLCITIDPANRRPGYTQYSQFHPTFAYEMILNFINAGIVYWLNLPRQQKRFDLRDGDVFWIYAIIYSIGRFIIESIRVDSAMAGDAKVPQLFAIATIVVAFAFIAFNHRTRGAKQLAAATADGRTVSFTSGGQALNSGAETAKVTSAQAAAETSNTVGDAQAAAEISNAAEQSGEADAEAASTTATEAKVAAEELAVADADSMNPPIPLTIAATEPGGGSLNAAEVTTGQQEGGELAADKGVPPVSETK